MRLDAALSARKIDVRGDAIGAMPDVACQIESELMRMTGQSTITITRKDWWEAGAMKDPKGAALQPKKVTVSLFVRP